MIEIPKRKVVWLEYLWNVGMSHHFDSSRSFVKCVLFCAPESACDLPAFYAFSVHNHCMTGISPNHGGEDEISQLSDLGSSFGEVEAHTGT